MAHNMCPGPDWVPAVVIDLDIPLGDTTPMGTPPEQVITPPEPSGQNRNKDIVPETP